MKLLIVSQHYYPDSFRINDIAEKFVKQGNDVTVLTSLPDYATGRVPSECRGLKNRKVNINGVDVIRCFSISRRSGAIFRALNYLSFLISSTVKAAFLKEKFDRVMCYQTSPVLMANAARTAANKQKIPFLIYCLDLWPECLKAWNVSEKSLLFKIMHVYSKRIYKRADVVGVSSKPFAEYLASVNDVNKEKIVYIPQHSEDMCLIEKSPDKPVRLAFGGNIGSVQNVDCILRAISHIKNNENFIVDIYGDGSELENCKKLANELNINNKVLFYGRVSREELWKAYNNTDAFLLTLKDDSAIGLTVPAKLQEYMSGGRPIFAAISGAAAEIINESQCGISVPSDDDIALADALKQFIDNPKAYKLAGISGRDYFEKHFTIDRFMLALENLFNKMG